MSTNSVNRIIKFCYLIPFFFLIKPDYFSYLGAFSSIYNLGFILFFALIVCKEFFLIKKRKEDTRRKNKKSNTKKPMVLNKKSPENSEDIKIII